MSDDLQEGLSTIERNAQIQAALIGDLLDMSRIITGKMRLDVQMVNLADVLEAALATARPAADAKGLRLQKVLDPAIFVAGDPGRLQQVFWNLLINAVKFTPRGGFVRVVMQRVNSHIEVHLADSGQGMTPEFLARAFDRFAQADSPQFRHNSGLGLGLAIVKNLVEMHGGSIAALSGGPGKGATFIVNLPLASIQPAGEDRVYPRTAITDSPAEVRGISLQGVKVLVVDDEPDARDLVRRVLSTAGAHVITASSAPEALRLLVEHAPDVLVSDVGLPGEDGYELIRKVRALGDGAGRVRAVALTAFARLDDRTKAMLSGFQMHLTKPTDARELIVTIATLVRK
jgi:CheY-like chemotaxis protein